ncbi:MAG: hypothetical protein IBJ03_08020 [Gemmatimonadaceae bacterium]|nr:hypothetical protein [Gemmatimonadaceae bacterium]
MIPAILHTALHAVMLMLMTAPSPSYPTIDSNPGTLHSAAPMGAARAAHTATTLRDGRVLIVGGFAAASSSVGAEIFDPQSGRYVSAGPMGLVRHSHTATRLADGRVLIVGGYGTDRDPVTRAEVYDPATNRFTATGAMHVARSGHVAVLLRDGTVLVVGGVGTGWSFLASAERYDPTTGRFTTTGAMSVARESHVAALLNNGRVVVIGGHQGRRANIKLFASAEEYDPASGQFSPVGDMAIRRHKHDAVLLADGAVLVTGGSDERDDRGAYRDAERYDPASKRFTRVEASMQHARYKHAGSSVLLPDGRVLIAGGATLAEVFDPAHSRFEVVSGSETLAGQFSAAALLPRGGVLITGGYGADMGPQARAWRFVP